MKNSKSLGRGITDLIEENKILLKEGEEVLEVEIDKIKPNPDQPRAHFDSTALKELASSIKEHGILQPVILKPSSNGYILVAGERRVRAARMAGRKSVPSIIRDYNSIYLTELAIMENLQREDLTPIEEAVAYEKAIKKLGLTQAELAKKIGKSRSYITNMIGLLNLPISVIEDVNNAKISMGHARVLSKLQDSNMIIDLSNKIKTQGLTVRKIEDLAKNIDKKNKIERKKKVAIADYSVIEKRLSNKLGYKITVDVRNSDLILKFSSSTELKKFLESIKSERNS